MWRKYFAGPWYYGANFFWEVHMTRLVDLSRPLQPIDRDAFPALLKPLLRIIAPEVDYVDHKRGAKIMQSIFGCPESDLPSGEGWAEDDVSISSHLGTHVDAPWHYGSTCEGKPAKTIDQIPLDELFCDAVVLDFTEKKNTGAAITVDDLKNALAKVPYTIQPGDAVLIRTDSDKYDLLDPKRYNYPGLCAESSLWLAHQEAKVGGTDALGWDRPFPQMVMDYQRTKDKRYIWDAHFALRDKEMFIVQQLANLDQLPSAGFKVAFFPINIVGASAAPSRVVAFVD
jgi:kynurenine formamidase